VSTTATKAPFMLLNAVLSLFIFRRMTPGSQFNPNPGRCTNRMGSECVMLELYVGRNKK
jgi:hypothetical protein